MSKFKIYKKIRILRIFTSIKDVGWNVNCTHTRVDSNVAKVMAVGHEQGFMFFQKVSNIGSGLMEFVESFGIVVVDPCASFVLLVLMCHRELLSSVHYSLLARNTTFFDY